MNATQGIEPREPPANPRRPHESAEAQIVFRHFARVLERLVPPPRGPDRPAANPPPQRH